MSKPIQWGDNKFPFLKIGTVVQTNNTLDLDKYYNYEVTNDNQYSITGFKPKLVHEVYHKCYGIFVNIYQNFMVDKFLMKNYFRISKENLPITRIISKSCFSVGVIDLANLFKKRADQVYNLYTLEILLNYQYPETKIPPIYDEFDKIKTVIFELRDRFYAHRDFNVTTESDKMIIWDFTPTLEQYFSQIVDQLKIEPRGYEEYLHVDQARIEGFITQKL